MAEGPESEEMLFHSNTEIRLWGGSEGRGT